MTMQTRQPITSRAVVSRRLREINRDGLDFNEFFTFVYGTLRPGEGNYWIGDAVLMIVEDCVTPGVMYARQIPFCDFTVTGRGNITGTLLLMKRDHRVVESMVLMEFNAGYDPMQVPVKLPPHYDNLKVKVSALAWNYPRASRRFSDKMLVPSGNWHDHPQSSHYRQLHGPSTVKRDRWDE